MDASNHMDVYEQRIQSAERRAEALSALQEREVALNERKQAAHEADVLDWDRRQREVNRHDILARVIEALVTQHAKTGLSESMLKECVRMGHIAADEAYPPKEPTE